MDELDGRLIDLFATNPRIGVLEASRRLGVARGTVQARLDKLAGSGVITGWGPDLSPAALGFPVTAFLTLEIRQETSRGGHDVVGEHLAAIAEVLEAHTITGVGDMWARVVARSNADLQRVIDRVLEHPAIVRSSTVIALATQVPFRVQPLARTAAAFTGCPVKPAPGYARPMAELVRTNDPALISAVEGLLLSAEIPYQVTDRNMSSIEGTIAVIQVRVLVPDERRDEARELLTDAELGDWLSS